MDKVHLILSDFEKYRKGFPIWGIIYVKINDYCFPDDQWWDIATSVLEMWATNLFNFLYSHDDSCTLDFMDGDYSMIIRRLDATRISLNCKKSSDILLNSNSIDLNYFIRQILSGVERLKNSIPELIGSSAIERLLSSEDKLRKALKSNSVMS